MCQSAVVVALSLIGMVWAGGGLFQRAVVVSMQSTDCLATHRSVMAALSGTPDYRRDLCAEYILASETTIFRVHASKSAPLLLPAEEVSFRPGKGALVLRRDDQQDDFEVKVVCMQLRSSRTESCASVNDAPAVNARKSR